LRREVEDEREMGVMQSDAMMMRRAMRRVDGRQRDRVGVNQYPQIRDIRDQRET
jgi:hypothetical protein